MLIRISLPAFLGLALLLPAGQGFAEPHSAQPSWQNTLRLAQAGEQKSDDDEAEERGKGRRDRGAAKEGRPSRDERGRGGKEAQQQQQRGKDGAEKAGRDAAEEKREKREAAREAARKAAEEKQQAEQEAARKAAEEKQQAEQEAARKAAEDKERAAREGRERRTRERTKDSQPATTPVPGTTTTQQRAPEPEAQPQQQRTTGDGDRRQRGERDRGEGETREQTKDSQPATTPVPGTTTTQQRAPEPEAQPQQQRTTGDGERRRRGDRERGPRDATRVQELVKEREARRTSAQELSKTQVTTEPTRIDGGTRMLRRDGNRVVIRSNDTDRLRGSRGNQRVEQLGGGQTRTVVIYPDGTQIITVTDNRGAIVHRSRRDRGGREVVLIREMRRPPLAQIDLGPLRISMPREHYIVDARRASRRDMYAALVAPPVEPVRQYYSLEEIRRFDRVRDIMPRIDISTITFDTDSAVISPGQIEMLADLADIMNELIDRNPDEVFLIEGHTDGVGSDLHNLALSDRRAEAVAIALTYYFDVPAENLVTQGFGKAFPKIPTELAERENRRVAVRRVTPLMAQR